MTLPDPWCDWLQSQLFILAIFDLLRPVLNYLTDTDDLSFILSAWAVRTSACVN